MKVAVLFAVALLCCPSVFAAELKSRDEAVALTDKIVGRIAAGDLSGGLALAKPYFAVPPAEFDVMVDKVTQQMPVVTARFGKSLGYEAIGNKTLSDSLGQVVYLQRFEQHGMVWRFVLYRGGDGWVLQSFNFNSDLATAF